MHTPIRCSKARVPSGRNMSDKVTELRVSLESGSLPPAKIKVIGVGGGGVNAVNRMIEARLEGVEFFVSNTGLLSLRTSRAPWNVQVGSKLSNGLGAGA